MLLEIRFKVFLQNFVHFSNKNVKERKEKRKKKTAPVETLTN